MADDSDDGGGGEFQSRGGLIRTALIDGVTFSGRAVQYTEVDGLAIFEGDICLGRIEDVEADTEALRRLARRPFGLRGDVIPGDSYRWPDGVIPYEIEPSMPNRERIASAIQHWHERTPIRLLPRNGQPDFVRFIRRDACQSAVGRRGGQQDIWLADGCERGAAIHEIFHAVGAWHEQSREDRDGYVRIVWENIEPGKELNFQQHLNDDDDYGPYDYNSIMHYPRDAFSANGRDTIVPLVAGALIGQRDHLSHWDVEAVRFMYPNLHWSPPKQDPKWDNPKSENPKSDNPKAENPKPESPKSDNPKAEIPKAENPKEENPKWDNPKPENPKAENPKWEDPKDGAKDPLNELPAKIAPWEDGLWRDPGALPFALATGRRTGRPRERDFSRIGTEILLAQLQQVLVTFSQLSRAGITDQGTAVALRATIAAYEQLRRSGR